MKLIHCADLHLDSPMGANLSGEKARERRAEILSTFRALVLHADENHVSALLIAGDLFDHDRVTKKTVDYVADVIRSHPDLCFFYLAGNHDRGNALRELEERPQNLYLFDKGWQSYALGEVTISGSERPDPDALTLRESDLNIVLMHGEERLGRTAAADSINLAALRGKHIDYLALGHIHEYRELPLDTRGVACYSGCLEGRGFDECGRHGYVLIEVENKRISHRFVPFAKRELHTVACDITDAHSQLELEERLLASVASIPSHHLVKAVLTGEYNADMLKDLPSLAALLSERFYFAKLRDESRLLLRPEEFQNDISLRGEFFRRVMASSLGDAEKERVIACGFRALSGEEIDL